MKKEDLWIERRTWEWHTGETKTQRIQVRFTVEDLKRVEEMDEKVSKMSPTKQLKDNYT